ncbi:CHAT domain-containing protein [Gangjinia marincola]|uniref:CHAT domain-containing protein n=1 Tax=Gangjinia marincola TaxID=578463 RepID=A0ABP3XWW0_9FLAO
MSKAENNIYKNKDSTLIFLKSAQKLQLDEHKFEEFFHTYRWMVFLHSYYNDLSQLNKTLESFIKDLSRYKNQLSNTLFERQFNDALLNKAILEYKLGNNNNAKKILKSQLNKLNDTLNFKYFDDPHGNIVVTSNFLREIYISENKLNLAQNIITDQLNSLEQYNEIIDNWQSYKVDANFALGKIYSKLNKFDEAIDLYEETISYLIEFSNNDLTKNYKFSAQTKLLNLYIKTNQFDQAKALINQLNEQDYLYNDNPKFTIEYTMSKGDYALATKDYEQAITLYQKSLAQTKAYRSTAVHEDLAQAHANSAKVYAAQGKFNKSLQQLQEGLQRLSASFNASEIAQNPTPDQVISKIALLPILRQKLELLQQAYSAEKKNSYLTQAHQTSLAIVATLDALKPEFESKLDKQFLIDETYPSFNLMMANAYALHQQTNDDQYLEDAFLFSEKSKAILLLEALQSSQVESFANVPQEIITKEQIYRAQITQLEKQQMEQGATPGVDERLVGLRGDYFSYLDSIKTTYPKYHELKYNVGVTSLSELQQKLDDQTTLASFFSQDNTTYAILVSSQEKHFIKLSASQEDMTELTNFCKDISIIESNSSLDRLKQTSADIYTNLFKTIFDSISTPRVVIVADGGLNYLPFDLLYDAEQEAYLINEFAISYANSATLYTKQQDKKPSDQHQLMAFAPSFSGEVLPIASERVDFGPLKYNTQEAGLISTYFNGQQLVGDQASLSRFKEIDDTYNIFHFATHAAANDEFPDYSYLAFAPKDSIQDLLYVKDLYTYSLNADLVTLSACQTGVGKLKEGEGMLSIARGFNYAGASSLVTSLWKVNDKSTATLMNYFYTHLDEGENKAEAMRMAKLDYLNNTDDELLKHPYYWAGFVVSGNTLPLTAAWSYWWYVLIGVVLLAGILFFSRGRNLRSKS